MAMRRKPYTNETTGWRGEARAEDMENDYQSRCRLAVPDAYHATYKAAAAMLAKGSDPDEIRQALEQPLHLVDERNDYNIVANRVERRLHEVRQRAVTDALARREANPPEE